MKLIGVKEGLATQVNSDMKIKNSGWIIVMCTVLLFTSCEKRMVPVASSGNKKEGFDTTLYEFALVEGSRNKMTGNAADALKYFQQALKMNTLSGVAPYEMSRILFIRGDKQGAVQYGKQAVINEPENIWYLSNLANIYLLLDQVDSTIIVVEKIVKLYPEEEEMLFNLAGLYIQKGEGEKGEKILRTFRQKYGDSEEIILNLLNALNEQGKKREAEILLLEMSEKAPEITEYQGMLAELYRVSGRNKEAEIIYENLFKSEPDNPTLLLSYLDYLFEKGRYDELLERINAFIINDSIEIDDKLVMLASIASDTLFLKEYGQRLVLSGMLLEANYPGNRDVKLALASVYRLLGEDEREIGKLKEIIEAYPRDYITREQLLLRLNEQERNEELYLLAGKVSRDFNVYPLPKLLLAYAANKLGKYEEALSELKKVRILINENPDFMMQVLLLEAEIYYNSEKYGESWQKFEEGLNIDPEDPLILNNYAYFLAEQNVDLKKAGRMVEKALTIEKNVTYLDTKAWILYKQGKFRKAARVMKEVIESGSKDPEILEHYGFILFHIGNCTEAIDYWQKALKEDPSKIHLLKEIEKCIK